MLPLFWVRLLLPFLMLLLLHLQQLLLFFLLLPAIVNPFLPDSLDELLHLSSSSCFSCCCCCKFVFRFSSNCGCYLHCLVGAF